MGVIYYKVTYLTNDHYVPYIKYETSRENMENMSMLLFQQVTENKKMHIRYNFY